MYFLNLLREKEMGKPKVASVALFERMRQYDQKGLRVTGFTTRRGEYILAGSTVYNLQGVEQASGSATFAPFEGSQRLTVVNYSSRPLVWRSDKITAKYVLENGRPVLVSAATRA